VGIRKLPPFCRVASCCLPPPLLPIGYLWDFVSPPRLPAI
jgi:hypothetical protein